MHFTEDDFENAILELFREQLGYDWNKKYSQLFPMRIVA